MPEPRVSAFPRDADSLRCRTMRRSTVLTRTIVVSLFVLSGALLSGCQMIKRNAVKSAVHDAFASTMTTGTELTDLGDGLYTYRWMTYRTAFLATDEGVLVLDPLNRDAAAGLQDAIERVAPDPAIEYVVYSHGHRDHASGADVFAGKPKILAHEKAAQEIEERDYSDVVAPTQTFGGARHTVELGGETVEFVRLPEWHGDGNIVTYFPERNTVYAVDLVWPNQLPPPAAPLSYSGSERALDALLGMEFDTFVPGHGAVSKREVVRNYRTFLDDLEREFRKSLAAHDLADFHSQATFESAPDKMGDVFFETIDALEPQYGHWENYDEVALNTVQWCLWAVLTGD